LQAECCKWHLLACFTRLVPWSVSVLVFLNQTVEQFHVLHQSASQFPEILWE
jgi:hypothetical protein